MAWMAGGQPGYKLPGTSDGWVYSDLAIGSVGYRIEIDSRAVINKKMQWL
jgi:hypothetical protein